MSVAVGLQVMAELMDDEVTAVVGPKHAKLTYRTAVRHASTAGSVVLGGRKITVRRPRARTTDGREVQLASYAAFADDDQLEAVVFERMLAGLATRRHRAAGEPVGQAVEEAARSTSKSAVSRRFVRRTARELEQADGSRPDLDTAVVMVDGICFADNCCVVALAVTADGTNSLMESFFGSMQIELLDRRTWTTRAQLTAAIFEWIEAWYNPTRRHSALAYRSPIEFEALHTAAPSAA